DRLNPPARHMEKLGEAMCSFRSRQCTVIHDGQVVSLLELLDDCERATRGANGLNAADEAFGADAVTRERTVEYEVLGEDFAERGFVERLRAASPTRVIRAHEV